jgi:hypothetical protein
LPSTLPNNFFSPFIHHPTLSKQKKEKENLYAAPDRPQKRKKMDLFPLTTLHKSKKWTCTQSQTLPKNKNKNKNRLIHNLHPIK